jgi:hypothetical protein
MGGLLNIFYGQILMYIIMYPCFYICLRVVMFLLEDDRDKSKYVEVLMECV